jgi:hypothetical protein
MCYQPLSVPDIPAITSSARWSLIADGQLGQLVCKFLTARSTGRHLTYTSMLLWYPAVNETKLASLKTLKGVAIAK